VRIYEESYGKLKINLGETSETYDKPRKNSGFFVKLAPVLW